MLVVILILASMWLAWTGLVDFFIVPAVFAQIPEFFMAGQLGITVFTKLNYLEFPVALGLLALNLWHFKNQRTLRWLILVNGVLVGIAALYLFSLTPKLTELTGAWEYAERMGTLGAGGVDVQSLHQSYHRTYVALDSCKMLLLMLEIGWVGVFLSRERR